MTTIDRHAHDRNRATNRLHTRLLAAGGVLLLAVTAWAFGGPAGIGYAVLLGAMSMLLARRVSPQMVLTLYKARRAGALEFTVALRIVEELARRAGLKSAPTLYVIPSKMMNAFAVGRRDDAAIAITVALAQTLPARQLAGVLAHEISHIAHEDIRVMALADMVSRFTSFMSTVGLFSLTLNVLGFAGGYAPQVPWLAVLVLIAAPTAGGLLQMALSRTREFDADLDAALLTGDPDGLAAALTRLEQAQGRQWEGLILPGRRMQHLSVLRSHPLTAERVKRLMALKAATGPFPRPAARPPQGRSMFPRIPRHEGPCFPGSPGISPLLDHDLMVGDLVCDDEGPASTRPLNTVEWPRTSLTRRARASTRRAPPRQSLPPRP